MSEYQYYEWQTVDRPLTNQERTAVNKLSSHISVSASGASVDYSWGDFKHDPIEVLADYFDVFVYMANWGDLRLAFRFPNELLNVAALQPYLAEPYISLRQSGDSILLDIDLSPEEPPNEWPEYEGWLDSFTPLRSDVLDGDYRVLYLAYLRALELDGGMEITAKEEPPVPPGLDKLTATLKSFVDWCGLSEREVSAAAKASAKVSGAPKIDFATAIRQLPRAECNDFLLRLAREEPHVGIALRKRLREVRDS